MVHHQRSWKYHNFRYLTNFSSPIVKITYYLRTLSLLNDFTTLFEILSAHSRYAVIWISSSSFLKFAIVNLIVDNDLKRWRGCASNRNTETQSILPPGGIDSFHLQFYLYHHTLTVINEHLDHVIQRSSPGASSLIVEDNSALILSWLFKANDNF